VVWQALLDPTILARVMPGCERLDQIGENEYKGTLKIRVGPVQGQFEGVVNLSDLNAPESYRMQVDGKGAPGFMKGVGEVRLEEQNGSTVMNYAGEAQVGGRIASVGQRLLESSAKALTKQSLEGLHEQIRALTQPAVVSPQAEFALIDEQPPEPQPQSQPSPPSPAVDVPAPSQTKFALGVARHLIDDLVPPPQRPKLIAAGVVFVTSLLVLDWWMTRIARKVANELLERRRR
jgi:carbon monoxide dehydrogenase subunit G